VKRAAVERLVTDGYDPRSLFEQPIVWGDHDAFQCVSIYSTSDYVTHIRADTSITYDTVSFSINEGARAHNLSSAVLRVCELAIILGKELGNPRATGSLRMDQIPRFSTRWSGQG
jgi:hypothetical protein